MEDLKLDDEPLPVLSSEGAGSLRSILIARESGILGRLPPRCISSKHASLNTPKNDTLNSSSIATKSDTDPTAGCTLRPDKKPRLIGLERQAQEAAEERLAGRELKVSECELKGRQTRSAFLVVFSPDRDLMASTHGDHNIYVSRVSNGKCISTLKGHPRTPWCVAFHPTRKGLLASGCLGGHVRLWDLLGDGSEVWRADGVVASLAFHPIDRLLVIATFNELHFWDWSQSLPFAKVTTASEKEKVRYVKFDSLGHQLITGIANLSGRDSQSANANTASVPSQQYNPSYMRRSFEQSNNPPYLNPRSRSNTGNNESDLSYGLSAYGRYRSVMSGLHLPHTRTETGSSDNRNRSTAEAIIRGTNSISSTNQHLPNSFHTSRRSETNRLNNRRGAEAETENGDRQGSASQTLSDLAAAASNRLMAENAAENAAARQTTRSILSSDSQNFEYTYPNRHDLLGALRTSRDPFFGTSFRDAVARTEVDGNASPASTSSNNQWATSEEMEAIRQSQMHHLRDLYQDPRSPSIFTSDLDGILEVRRIDEALEDRNRLRDYNSSFSHSPESSFIEVNGATGNGRSVGIPQYDGTNRTQVIVPNRTTARETRALAQERYRVISERRLRRLLGRRQALVSQIEDLRNARDYLTNLDRRRSTSLLLGRDISSEISNSTAGQLRRNSSIADSLNTEVTQNMPNESSTPSELPNENPAYQTSSNDETPRRTGNGETRVIDEWARARRRKLEFNRRRNLQSDSYQIRRSYNHYGALNLTMPRRNSANQRNNSATSQSEENRSREQQLSHSEIHNLSSTSDTIDIGSQNLESNFQSSPVEPNVVALPESSVFSSMTTTETSSEYINELNRNDILHTHPISNVVSGTAAQQLNQAQTEHPSIATEEIESSVTNSEPEGRNSSDPSINSNVHLIEASMVESVNTSSESSQNISDVAIPNTNINLQNSNTDTEHNDHTYSNPESTELGAVQFATNGPSSEIGRIADTVNISAETSYPNSNHRILNGARSETIVSNPEAGNSSSNSPSELVDSNAAVTRSNLDITLLSRHIDHMQRICRASLADCALNRHRRQVVRLQSIRRMLEDLQRQIRCLRAASNEELNRRSREAESLGSVLGNLRQRNRINATNDGALHNREPSNSNYSTSPLGQEITNEERENEEEGHFDLVDEDAMIDDNMNTREMSRNASPLAQSDEIAHEVEGTRFRGISRLQSSARMSNINYALRNRAFNRDGRISISSRLRRNTRQNSTMSNPRLYRYQFRRNHTPGTSSSGATAPTIPRTPRNPGNFERAVVTDSATFTNVSNGRRYYRGRNICSRVANANNSVAPTTTAEARNTSRTRRTRLSRVHNQLFSQLRATVRAMEMSPALAETNDRDECGTTNEASHITMEGKNLSSVSAETVGETNRKTASQNQTGSKQLRKSVSNEVQCKDRRMKVKKASERALITASSTKGELRALSQRLEKFLKDRRQNICCDENSINDSPSVASTSNTGLENSSKENQDMEYTLSEGEKYLMSLPRPEPGMSSPNGSSLSDPRLRWRHLMEGIDDHLLNDPMPPRRSMRYGFQRHYNFSNRDHDLYIRQNYRNQRRDSSPLTGRTRSNRIMQAPHTLLDGTLPSAETGTDSGSDTDDATLNFNEAREFPHNSSLEWNGGTSSSPLFRHGLGRWPVRRLSRREELMDIYGAMGRTMATHGRSIDRNQAVHSSLNLNRQYNSGEHEERELRDRQRTVRNRAAARASRLARLEQVQHVRARSLLDRQNIANNQPPEVSVLSADMNNDNTENRSHPDSLIRNRSPITTTTFSRVPGDIGVEHRELSFNEDQAVALAAEETGSVTLDMERLPPLRELIWRRLRRRNAQLNMLEDEIAGTNGTSVPNTSSFNVENLDRTQTNLDESGRASNANTLTHDINRPHREFLTWMVDQMRLDQESGSPPDAVRRRINALSEQEMGSENNTGNEFESANTSIGPSTRHISFSREFITPPPIQYRHRFLNLQEDNASDTSDITLTSNSRRFITREVRPRPSSYAAAALNGASVHQSTVGTNASSNPQTSATAATFQREHYYLHNAPANMLLTHRIQSWDFDKGHIPDLRDSNSNLVVNEARIHNDASVDISEDGSILVTLIPSNMPMTTVVGVYGLKPNYNRGRCYATYSLESSAVSVSLSPTSRYLLVGLAVRTGRLTLSPTERTLMGQIFRIQLPHERNGERGRLVHRKDLHQTEQGQTSLNCIRWIPVAGQGIVYATNTGLLKILR